MNFNEKKIWKIIALIGTFFMTACFVVSLVIFFNEKQYKLFTPERYVGIAINLISAALFFCMNFKPMDKMLPAFICYIYGVGNFIDTGNIMGFICLVCSAILFYQEGKIVKKNIFWIIILSLLALACLLTQVRDGAIEFIKSVCHIAGGAFIVFMIFAAVYPKTREKKSPAKMTSLSPDFYSQTDVKMLTSVLKNMNYSDIARQLEVSESKVKARMIELYKALGVSNRETFVARYSGNEFVLGEEIHYSEK